MNLQNEISILENILHLSQEELADALKVTFETVNRWENQTQDVEKENVEKVYNFAFSKGIFLNALYEQLLIEEYSDENTIVLFHGAKTDIKLPIDLDHSKKDNDFGVGFYLGEKFQQAGTYVAQYEEPSVYCFSLNKKNLKSYQFHVDRKWMMAIAYFRGWFEKYTMHPYLDSLLKEIENVDILIAPIADNRMFDLISEFARGELTDIQCQHALAATNLGMQYVLRKQRAIEKLTLLRKSPVCKLEKEKFRNDRAYLRQQSLDKVKLARIEYRGKGVYIDEIMQ